MFLFLHDVDESLGPPHFISKQLTGYQPPFPNWLSRSDRPQWYEQEVSGAGPAGTVVAFGIDTFHRGTELTRNLGARYTIHVGFRNAGTEWASRISWADHSHEQGWYDFVAKASLRQLLLFGFPAPGHEFWTPQMLEFVGQRYPGLDMGQFSG